MSRTGATIREPIWPYLKQCKAYAYIPFTSFHGLHIFLGWMPEELIRLLTNSSNWELWREAQGGVATQYYGGRPREGCVFFTTIYAQEDTNKISSGQFLKRLHGHEGLSYLLRAAKGSAMSFSRPTEPVFSPFTTHRSGLPLEWGSCWI